MKKKKVAVFASGNGTNALQLIKHFKNHSHIQIGLIVTNHSKAGVIKIAEENNIPFAVINKSLLANNSYMTAYSIFTTLTLSCWQDFSCWFLHF